MSTIEKRKRETSFRASMAGRSVAEIGLGDSVKNGTAWAVELFMHAFRKERQLAGLTLDAISERTGIDKATLSKLENGKLLNAQVDTLMRLALSLGKSIRLEMSEHVKPLVKSNLDRTGVEAYLKDKKKKVVSR